MSFQSPTWLFLFLLVPLLLLVYLLVQGRNRQFALRFTNMPVLAQVAQKRPGWRRHVGAALFLAMIALMVTGLGGPSMPVSVPRDRATIMVAIDVSLSMEARDVEPSRFEAAKTSAKQFIEGLPARFNVGVVAFAGTANVVASPSSSRYEALRSIDNLRLSERTAIGDAVFACLAAIQSFDAGTGDDDPPPAHVVLLSDGDNTYGKSISEAITASTDAQVPVSTIAFGTPYGQVTIKGETTTVDVNKPELRRLALATNGKAYEAEDSGQLSEVYESIGTSLGHTTEDRDVSSWFLGFALLIAVLTGGLSLLWFSRLP